MPDDARVLRFSAVVDRGLEITEGDETNNELESWSPSTNERLIQAMMRKVSFLAKQRSSVSPSSQRALWGCSCS